MILITLNAIILMAPIYFVIHMIRCEKAFKLRMSVIEKQAKLNKDRIKKGQLDLVNFNMPDMPSVDYMVRRFWIWNFSKFLPKEDKCQQQAET